MIKNKIDFKLINMAIICLILFLLYQTSNLWLGIVLKIWKIIMPFFFAFAIAYAVYPFLTYLRSKKIPKSIAILIIIALVVGVIVFVGITIVPLLVDQLSSLFNSILAFIKEFSLNYDINLGELQSTLNTSFNEIISNLGKYISDGAISAINISLDVISKIFIGSAATIYFLIDMDKIRLGIRSYFKGKSKKTFYYVRALDDQMKRYISGFIKIAIISIAEYAIVYAIIGHPNALLLGFLMCISGLIPYFGGIIVNSIAAITAFVISPALFIKTIIVFCVLSNVDGYVINPFIYGKTNQIHPLVGIVAVFAGGILFGIMGIVISLPLAIILITTYKFYKSDIADIANNMKEHKVKVDKK